MLILIRITSSCRSKEGRAFWSGVGEQNLTVISPSSPGSYRIEFVDNRSPVPSYNSIAQAKPLGAHNNWRRRVSERLRKVIQKTFPTVEGAELPASPLNELWENRHSSILNSSQPRIIGNAELPSRSSVSFRAMMSSEVAPSRGLSPIGLHMITC